MGGAFEGKPSATVRRIDGCEIKGPVLNRPLPWWNTIIVERAAE